MNIAVIGCGVYSLAMSKRLAKDNKNNIIVWSEDPKKVKEFNDTNMIKSIFKTEKFSKNIRLTNDYEECIKNADILFMMTAMPFLESTLINLKKYYKSNIPVVIGTKGIDVNSIKFPSHIVNKVLKTNNIAVIAGPSFAIDILNDELLALTVATKKRKIYKMLKTLYTKENNSVIEHSKDLLGVQLSSTLKNVYAIGSGIINGLKMPESNTSIYLTKVFKEYDEILFMLSGDYRTLLSLAGLGDTIMTCSDSKSRNYTYGTKLCSKSKKTAQNYADKTTVEGLHSINAIATLLKKKHINTPLLYTIKNIINSDVKPEELKNELLKLM